MPRMSCRRRSCGSTPPWRSRGQAGRGQAGRGPGEQWLSEPLAYLYRIVRNLSLDLRRKLGRERNRQVADSEERMAQIGEYRPSPEAAVVARHELALVVAAMAELPERTRIALEMHRFGGCSLREISAHLGISVGLVHSLVTDGLEHCRQRLYRR